MYMNGPTKDVLDVPEIRVYAYDFEAFRRRVCVCTIMRRRVARS